MRKAPVRLNAVDTATPPALKPGDILILTVKAQDVEAATDFWAWRDVEGAGLASELPLVTRQNGLAAEDIALIPTVIDQHPCAHLRWPIDMIFHGRCWSVRQA